MLIIRYVVVKYPTYSATVTASANAANKTHILLFNGSSNVVRIRKIVVHAEVTGTVTGYEISYRLQRIDGYSGGTALSIQPFNTSREVPSGISAVANPTSIVNPRPLLTLCVNPEETGGIHIVDIDTCVFEGECITLRQNEGVALQQYGTAGVGSTSSTIIFTVE
ncbi:MAG: hypothetical protein QXW41_08135 [Fervidicoccaceae archaeon]